MKRRIRYCALPVCLLMLLSMSLTACGTSEADLIGKWKLEYGTYDGEKEYDSSDSVFVFKENGEGEWDNSSGFHADFTWTLEDDTLLMRVTYPSSFFDNDESFSEVMRYQIIRLTSSELVLEQSVEGKSLQIVFTR